MGFAANEMKLHIDWPGYRPAYIDLLKRYTCSNYCKLLLIEKYNCQQSRQRTDNNKQ